MTDPDFAPDRPTRAAEGATVISESRAKQGRAKPGMMLVLVISTLAAVVLVFGIWAARSGVDTHPQASGGEDRASAAASRSFNEPMSSPKQNPPPASAAANK
jgi:hypothetical protein